MIFILIINNNIPTINHTVYNKIVKLDVPFSLTIKSPDTSCIFYTLYNYTAELYPYIHSMRYCT